MNRTRTLAFAATAAVLGLGVAALMAAPAPADPAKARHQAMEQIGDAMKMLATMAKGQLAFDPKLVRDQATIVSERLEQAAQLFPPGSDAGETHARPEIWSDRPGFDNAMKDAQAAAAALQSVQDEAAFRPALGRLGQSCNACHDKYRMSEH